MPTDRRAVTAPDAPAAVGPYRHGVVGAFLAEIGVVDPPARVTVGVAALPLGAEIEMDAVVAVPG